MDKSKQNVKVVVKPVKVVKGTKKQTEIMYPCKPIYGVE